MIFEDLNVNQELVRGLNEMGIKEPTEIQQKAIPLIKQGNDVISISKTGSGKTAAFGIPILESVKHGQGVQFLVIAPVRELAVQIAQELRKFGKHVRFSVACVYGGLSIGPQIKAIETADIVVGTPGRLLDHLENYNLNLGKIRCVVLDEADKMVEMGFIEDIKRILNKTPKQKQILLFGATISEEVNEIKKRYMNEPITAKTETHVEEEYLAQYYYNVKQHEKFSLLMHLLNKEKRGLSIIFCSARSTVEIVKKNLRINGIKAEMIHGKLSQNRRLKVIEDFHNGRPEVLVASAIAARGLDIKDVTHIFNYDLSRDPQEYIHRVGRTARAGQSGKAITLLSEKDHDTFREIMHRYPVNVKELPPEEFQILKFDPGQRRNFDNDRFSGGRRSYGRSENSNADRSYSNANRSYGSYRRSNSSGDRPREYGSRNRSFSNRRTDRNRESSSGNKRERRGYR